MAGSSALRRGRGGARGGRAAALALVALAVVELVVLFQGFSINSAVMAERVRYQDPVVPASLLPVAHAPGLPRFTGVSGALHPSQNIIYGLFDLRSFEAMYPRTYVAAMGAIEGFSMDEAVGSFFEHGWCFDVTPANLGGPLLDELGVGWVLSATELTAPGLELEVDGPVKTYRREGAYPRSWVVGAGGQVAPSSARVSRYSWDLVEVEVDGPGTLVLSDQYLPGWRAEVDGRAVRIGAHRDLLRSVEVGAGQSRASFYYRPVGFRLGLWLSVVSALGLVVVFSIKLLVAAREVD